MAGRLTRHEIYRRLDETIAELLDRMGGLPNPVEAEDIWTAIWFQEAHRSTAIEGNTLVLTPTSPTIRLCRCVGGHQDLCTCAHKGYALPTRS